MRLESEKFVLEMSVHYQSMLVLFEKWASDCKRFFFFKLRFPRQAQCFLKYLEFQPEMFLVNFGSLVT